MEVFFDYYTFSEVSELDSFIKYLINKNYCIAVSLGGDLTEDAFISMLSKHFGDKSICVLRDEVSGINNSRYKEISVTPKNVMQIIRGLGRVSPLSLMIILKSNCVFINIAVISFAKQYNIPVVTIMDSSGEPNTILWY